MKIMLLAVILSLLPIQGWCGSENKKVVDYMIVRNDISWTLGMYGEFAEKVKKLIREGWQPKGGAVIDYRYGIIMQAMVKYEDK